MEFELNETQKLFKSSARELFAAECPPQFVREVIEKGEPYSEALWEKLVEQGWTGLIFSEEDGGLGLGMVEMAVAFEEMGHALVPGAFLSCVPLAGALVERAGTKEQKAKYLSAICDGKLKATVALLEADAAWDAGSAQMSATETADGLLLNGTKLFVADAGTVDYIITAARVGSEIALPVVSRKTSGVSVKLMPSIDATRNLY